MTLITQYFAYQTAYPLEVTPKLLSDAFYFLKKIEKILLDLGLLNPIVTSGWRPIEVNKLIGGAPKSYHCLGRAIDLRDEASGLYKLIEERSTLLTTHGLWLEDGRFTKGWVHLDEGERTEREIRIFKP